jgi:hypothetical protein
MFSVAILSLRDATEEEVQAGSTNVRYRQASS